MNEQLGEREKVRKLYDLIGQRGLYVSTNFDVFTEEPEVISLAEGAGHNIPLLKKGSAFSSPLLFATLTSLLNHGTMLITGAPGIGKTTGAEFAGHFFTGTPLDEILASEIQGHPQLTEEKMVASYDIPQLMAGKKVVLPTRFLQSSVKILDEGNRTPPDVLSIIMRLADTGMAVYGGQLLQAKRGPLFVTANYTDEGTFHFTPPFLDRFDVAAMVTSPQPWDLGAIRARGDEKLNGGLEAQLTIPSGLKLNFDQIRKEIKDLPETAGAGDVPEATSFADFMYGSLRFSEAASNDLSRATKGNAWQVNQDNAAPGHFQDSPFNYTLNELSVRTAKAIPRYARAFAWLAGKESVGVQDVKAVLPYLLWHKVQPTTKALTEGQKFANDRIAFVEELVKKVEGDYTEMSGSDMMKSYNAALRVVREGKIGSNDLTEDEIRTVVTNAMTQIGNVDKPYALTLANHVAAEYNVRLMNKDDTRN